MLDFRGCRPLAQDAYSCVDLTNDTSHSVAGELFKLSRVQRKVARHGGRARILERIDEKTPLKIDILLMAGNPAPPGMSKTL